MSDNYLFSGMYKRTSRFLTKVLEQYAIHGQLPGAVGEVFETTTILDATAFPGLQQHTMARIRVECIDIEPGCRTLLTRPADDASLGVFRQSWAPADLSIRAPLVGKIILRDHRDEIIEAAQRLVVDWRSRSAPPVRFSIVVPRRRVTRLTAGLKIDAKGFEYIEVRPDFPDGRGESVIFEGDGQQDLG